MNNNKVKSGEFSPGSNNHRGRAGRFLTNPLNWLASLRMKLVVPYVVLSLAAAMGGIYIITRLVSSSVRERFVNQLVEANRVAGDLIVRREKSHLENLRLMAFTEGVHEAILANDSAQLQSLLFPLVVNENIHSLSVINLKGQEILSIIQDLPSGEYSLSGGADLSDLELVELILSGTRDEEGDKFSSFEQTSLDYYLLTSAPVSNADAQLAGVLIIGSDLAFLATDLKTQALADIILLDQAGSLMATTFSDADDIEVSLSLAENERLNLDLSYSKEIEASLRKYQTLYAPLIVRGNQVGYIGVALATNFIVNTEATSRNTVSIIFTLATAAIALIGILVAFTIARPVLQLRNVAMAVAAGKLDQRSNVHRNDEIGDLARSFDIMISNLQDRTIELIQSEKLSAVGLLSAGIAHDVKNPLAVIKGLAEEIQEEVKDQPEIVDYLSIIMDNANRADVIITDLMTFTRQSNNENKSQDICDSVDRAVRMTAFLARKGDVNVTVEHQNGPIMASFDAQQLGQVYTNLIQNAIQAMPLGGDITITTTREEEYVFIVIRDTGSGIPKENLERIFDPFFTTKAEGEGTGLGLSVSHRIIKEHKGELRVHSVIDYGTEFIIKLPLETEGEFAI